MADVVFPSIQTIVEVKSVTSDGNDKLRVRRKAGEIYNRWADAGLVPPLLGSADVHLSKLPKELADELSYVAGDRVRREIGHANVQIRETATRLGYSDPTGLVVFVVPAHFSTDATILGNAAIRELSTSSFRSINGFVMLEAWTEQDRDPDRMLMGIPATSPGRRPPNDRLVTSISLEWISIMSRAIERNIAIIPIERDESRNS